MGVDELKSMFPQLVFSSNVVFMSLILVLQSVSLYRVMLTGYVVEEWARTALPNARIEATVRKCMVRDWTSSCVLFSIDIFNVGWRLG